MRENVKKLCKRITMNTDEKKKIREREIKEGRKDGISGKDKEANRRKTKQ